MMKVKKAIGGVALLGLFSATAHAQFSEYIVEEPSLGASALLGTDLSIHDEMAVIGANGVSSYAGQARIYDWNASAKSWDHRVSLSSSNAAAGEGFGGACAIHDSRVVVGSPGAAANGVGLAGLAEAYDPWSSDPDIYFNRGVMYASDPEANSRFGEVVAVRGDWILIGAPERTWQSALNAKGAVYCYEHRSTYPNFGPTQDVKIRPLSGQVGERFGSALDMSGSRAIIGAPLGGSNAGGTGRAYVYELSSGSWSEEDTLTPGEDAGDFGASVSIYVNYAVVGAPADESDTASWQNSGSAFVFERSGDEWELVAKLTPPDEENNLLFGIDVAIDDRRIVVGTLDERAYVYSRRNLGDGAEWFLSGKLEASDGQSGDDYGRKVAMGGEHFAVGARLADPTSSTTSGGKAYFYSYPEEFAAYCFANEGDCPCGNDDPDAGCENSTGSGAFLKALGTASLAEHNLRLRVTDLPLNKSVIAFVGPESNRAPLADGLLCVGGSILRLDVKNSGADGAVSYFSGQTIDVPAPAAGDVLYYQSWYRDTDGPCDNGTNLSNAVRVKFGL